MPPVFFDNFESGLGAFTTHGVIATSTDESCDLTHSLKVTTSATDGPYIITPALTGAGVYNTWFYVSFGLFVADFADFWQGGANLDPNICAWAQISDGAQITSRSAIWIEPTSNSTAELQASGGVGSYGSIVEADWNSIVYGIIFDNVLTQTRREVWINGVSNGVHTTGSLPASPGGYFQLGDRDETWGGFTQASFYIDPFSYQPTTQLPDIVCGFPVNTFAPTGVGTTSATLEGEINPEGVASTGYFEYGLTTSYGTTTPAQNIGSGTSPVAFDQFVTGLRPGRTYHYRAVRNP